MKAKTILTPEQRRALEKLWFIYGNNGKKHTHQNHRYIQNFIETGEDTEDFYRNSDKKRTIAAGIDWKTIAITEECITAVKEILKPSPL